MNEPKAPSAVISNDLLCASMILQGLLASGHFTDEEGDDCDGPSVRRYDLGNDWRDCDADRRFNSHAVGSAVSLLRELKEALDRYQCERS